MNRLTAIGMIALCLAVGACHGSSDNPPLSADTIAREDYARITAEADVILFGDILGYPEGTRTPTRVPVSCSAGVCSIGFTLWVEPGRNFNTDGVELEITTGPNGVRQVVERGTSERSEVHVLGGWMTHSLFASQADERINELDPDLGAFRTAAYVLGSGSGTNPTVLEGGATWRGFVVGRDVSVTDNLEAVVSGDALISVDLGGIEADVAFTNLVNSYTEENHADMSWNGLTITDGSFAREDAEDDRISGQFFGPEHEEVAGIFEHAGVSGAFGGLRD